MEKAQATKFMHDLLRLMLSKKASDLFITAGFPPALKVDGKMTPVSQQALSSQHTEALAHAIMNEKQAAEFEQTKECNFAFTAKNVGRFRVQFRHQSCRYWTVSCQHVRSAAKSRTGIAYYYNKNSRL